MKLNEASIRLRRWLAGHFTGESIDHRQLISLVLPILIDQMFIFGLALVNTVMISSSGMAAVSAVHMVDSINILLISTFLAIATGGTVVIAQYRGSGNDEMVRKAAASTISAVCLFALVISLLVIVCYKPILNVLFGAADPDVSRLAGIYLVGSGISFFGVALREAVCGVLRGIGKTRVTLALSLIMNVSYVLLNVLFLYVLDLGVFGMAISVVISRYLAAVCALYYMLRLDTSFGFHLRDAFRLNMEMLRKIWYIGFPFASEQLFFNGGKLLTQIFIVGMGTSAVAVNAIAGSIAMVAQIAPIAFSIAIVTVVGQCVGRGNIADARKLTRSFLWLASFAFILMAALIIPLVQPIIGLFQPPNEIRSDIAIIVIVNAIVMIPLWSLSFLLPNALRAAGDSRFTSITAMITMWTVRIVLGYLLGVTLQLGVLGIWTAMQLEWIVRSAFFLWRYKGESWYRHRLVEPASGGTVSR